MWRKMYSEVYLVVCSTEKGPGNPRPLFDLGGNGLQQAQLASFCHGLGTVAHVQLVKDVGNMPLGRPDGDDQLTGYLLVRAAGGHQVQHFQFTTPY